MKLKLSLTRQVERLLRRERALADFGTFAFREPKLQAILDEAARVCAECLGVPFSKISRFQAFEDDLLVVAGHGWDPGVVNVAVSLADESSPQGRAFITGEPQLCPNINAANAYTLPPFYAEHGIVSTVDVLVAARDGPPFGVLEVDSQRAGAFDEHDIDFLTSFANVLAEAVMTATRAKELQNTLLRMEELVAEKDVLHQELKHRVRNRLHLVYGLLLAEIDGAHPEASIAAFRAVALRVMSLAEVFDHLLGVGMSKVINFADYVTSLCENLPDLYRLDGVKLTSVVEPLRLELGDATALGIAVTELVNNAYLHAFPNGVGEVSVALRVTSGHALLSVSDNGVGFVEVENKRHGIGLVRRFVNQVGGTLNLQSDTGTTWTITLAVDEVSALVAT